MSKLRIAFYVVTALFTLAILPGAVMDIVQPEMVVDIAQGIGIPLHVMTLVGIWKLLGLVALWLPRKPRLTEWAYAGFVFDLTGAAWWHGGADDLAGIAPPLFILAIGLGSYFLRRASQPGAEVAATAPVAAAA